MKSGVVYKIPTRVTQTWRGEMSVFWDIGEAVEDQEKCMGL